MARGGMFLRKPRVGVDVDDVLADFNTPAMRLMSDFLGKRITPDMRKTWDLEELIPSDRIEDYWRYVGSQKGLIRNLNPLPGAVEGIEKLKKVASVYIVTAHLYHGETWVHERDRWVEEHLGLGHSRVVHTKAKFTFSASMLIDDKPKNVEEWGKEHREGVPVLWTRPHNTGTRFSPKLDSRVVRTNDWDEVVALVGGSSGRAQVESRSGT
jgi:5'(3')-deoxyribonucleotidase